MSRSGHDVKFEENLWRSYVILRSQEWDGPEVPVIFDLPLRLIQEFKSIFVKSPQGIPETCSQDQGIHIIDHMEIRKLESNWRVEHAL